MAIHEDQIRSLARRIHQRWLEYRRRHPGRSVPIDDTLSRILEHDPEYRPPRPRTAATRRPPLRNPGVFTLKAIADSLQTNVGDLLGERGYAVARDALTASERRKLREAVALLRDLFDLDDLSLGGDFDTPETLQVWIVPDADALPSLGHIREITNPHFRVIRVRSDAMAPDVPNGSTVVIDCQRINPAAGEFVAVQTKSEGAVLGRWEVSEGKPRLVRTNPAYLTVPLDDAEWTVLGTVSAIVEKHDR